MDLDDKREILIARQQLQHDLAFWIDDLNPINDEPRFNTAPTRTPVNS